MSWCTAATRRAVCTQHTPARQLSAQLVATANITATNNKPPNEPGAGGGGGLLAAAAVTAHSRKQQNICNHVEDVKTNSNGFRLVRRPEVAQIDREQHISNNGQVQVVRRQLIRQLMAVRGRNHSLVVPKQLVAQLFRTVVVCRQLVAHGDGFSDLKLPTFFEGVFFRVRHGRVDQVINPRQGLPFMGLCGASGRSSTPSVAQSVSVATHE